MNDVFLPGSHAAVIVLWCVTAALVVVLRLPVRSSVVRWRIRAARLSCCYAAPCGRHATMRL